jgi:hypothetical protein
MPDASTNSAPKVHGSEKRQRARGAILVRLLPDERAAIEKKARQTGLSLASFLRTCGLGTPGPRAKRSAPVDAEALARATAALNKVGSNLNQIAHVLNAGGSGVTTQQCFAAMAEVRAALCRILEIVGRKDRP